MLCDAMKWNHLPEAGGLYDQNPKIIDRFYYILAQRSKVQSEDHRRQMAEMKGKSKGGGRRVAGRR